ncbi:hypothetical protein F4677DRAFT_441221 [Hypoxylon crocopeplum]|nr:hypothetical protein F4677DRAFT_441221 [Hypoxylon crocopeplum]
MAWEGCPDIAVVTGRLGDGVLGPFEDGADVKDDCESPFELAEDAIELTRGDDVLEEYASGAWDVPRVCGWEIGGRSSFTTVDDKATTGEIEQGSKTSRLDTTCV